MNIDHLFDACGWTLIHFLWQGTVIGVVLLLALACVPYARAQLRYLIACTALASMAAIATLTFAWEVAQPAVVAVVQEYKLPEASEPSAEPVPRNDRSIEHASLTEVSPAIEMERIGVGTITAPIEDESSWAQWLSVGLAPWLDRFVLVWSVGVALLALRLAVNWFAVQQLRSTGHAIEEVRWQEPLMRLRQRLRIRGSVALRQSAAITVPMVLGWLRPVILVPTEMVSGLTPGQLEAILAHELAHIRRYDYAVNLLQNLAETVLFFHPAVWWASAQIRKERECCCDAIAAELCHGPLPYSEALLAVETFRSSTPLAIAASGGSLLQRIRRLTGQPSRSPQAAGAMLVLLIVVGLATIFALQTSEASAEDDAATISNEQATKLAVAAHAKARAIDRLPAFYSQIDYRNGDVATMTAEEVVSLENLRRALTEPVAEEKWVNIDNLLAWDATRVLSESLSHRNSQDNDGGSDWYAVRYYDSKEAWCQERSGTRPARFFRLPSFEKSWQHSSPLAYQFIQATPRTFWWGDNDYHNTCHNRVDPAIVTYRHLGQEEMGGETCDIVESKGRAERLWIGRKTGLIHAALYYVYYGGKSDLVHEHPAVKKIAGQMFPSAKDYYTWYRQQKSQLTSAEIDELGEAFFEANFDHMANASCFVQFGDYQEISPGAWYPFTQDRIVCHTSKEGEGKYAYIRCESRVKKCTTDVDLTERIEKLKPQTGDFVQDQRVADAVIEYDWRDDISQAEIDHLVQQKQLELEKSQELIDKLKVPMQKLVGQAAPPLTDGKWLGEQPQLSGKPTLVHFWAAWCGPCKNDYAVLNQIAKKGQVIGIHPPGTPEDDIAAAIQDGAHIYPTFAAAKSDEDLVGGYPVKMYPYCVVLDAEGRVAAHGSLHDVASKFHELNDAVALAAENKEAEDPQESPEEEKAKDAKLSFAERQKKLKQEAAPYLQAMIEAGYRLDDDQNIKRIAPPFPDSRAKWYKAAHPSQYQSIPAGPDLLTFHYSEGNLESWRMVFGGQHIGSIVETMFDIYPQNIAGPSDFLSTQITGDWVVRPEAKGEKLLPELSTIFNDQLKLNVKMRFEDQEREVYVMKGKYQFKPLPEFVPKEDALRRAYSQYDTIQIFGAKAFPDGGAGGGTGTFQLFNQWLGRWIDVPIVIEATNLPEQNVSFRLHAPSPATPVELKMAHDPDLVLATISSQTGLEFVKEKRKVRMLVIEPGE